MKWAYSHKLLLAVNEGGKTMSALNVRADREGRRTTHFAPLYPQEGGRAWNAWRRGVNERCARFTLYGECRIIKHGACCSINVGYQLSHEGAKGQKRKRVRVRNIPKARRLSQHLSILFITALTSQL